MNKPNARGHASGRPRIQALIDAKRLHEQEAGPEQVSALWQKAVESAADAELEAISIDGAIRSAYAAGHLATLALLAVHGLRTSPLTRLEICCRTPSKSAVSEKDLSMIP